MGLDRPSRPSAPLGAEAFARPGSGSAIGAEPRPPSGQCPSADGDRSRGAIGPRRAVLLLGLLGLAANAVFGGPSPWTFTEITKEAGFDYEHGFVVPLTDDQIDDGRRISGGVAAGDVDGDGWVDLYVERGDIGPNLLFRNRGDGTFEEVGAAAGVAVTGEIGSGPSFGDIDGDGWLDLFVGGIDGVAPRMFRNLGDGTFEEVESLITSHNNTLSAAWADVDLDGDLDLGLAHWEHILFGCTAPCDGHLWRNDGPSGFTEADGESDLTGFENDYTFTPNFADIDGDGWPDLLIAADWLSSRVFLNRGDGTFADVTDDEVITDENGMGAAVGDYDNDGDLDWFVTSIYSQPPVADGTKSGNRLYRNAGDGTFEEVSEAAGVRIGYWGWGACFGDFDNDGHLDIFHVNGFRTNPTSDVWLTDPSRLFLSNGDGTFTESSASVGLEDTGQGRGLTCFDFDRDGDLDLFVANNSQAPAFYRNDGGNARNFLNVRLRGDGGNRLAVGARVEVTAEGVTQMREVAAGSNFQSQQPLEVHFGLGDATEAEVRVRWLSGTIHELGTRSANLFLLVHETGEVFIDGFESGDASRWSSAPSAP